MHKIPILTYHSISDSVENRYDIPPIEFRKQMRYLYESRYKTLIFNESGEFLPEASGSFFILTFDDGHKSNFDTVLPILKEFSFKAIFFISTGLIERDKAFMDWQQVRGLFNNGHSIQSHGHSHRFLSHLTEKEVFFELSQSRDLIKENTHTTPITFSCPGGRYSNRVIRIAKEMGYKKMFISEPNNFITERDNKSFTLGRFMITSKMHINDLKKIYKGSRIYLSILRLKYNFKYLLKTAIGDSLYHSIWKKSH